MLALKFLHDLLLHVGNIFCKKSFWRTVLCREIKNKNLNNLIGKTINIESIFIILLIIRLADN